MSFLRTQAVRLMLLLLAVGGLSACSSEPNKYIAQRTHQGPITVPNEDSNGDVPHFDPWAVEFSAERMKTMGSLLFSGEPISVVLGDVVEPVGKILLTERYLDHPYKNDNDRHQRVLDLFYGGVQEVLDQSPAVQPVVLKDLLARYEKFLWKGCENGGWNNCRFHRSLAMEPSAARLIWHLAKQKKDDVRDFYRYLKLTLDVNKTRWQDPDVIKAIVGSSLDLFRSFIEEKGDNSVFSLSVDHLSTAERDDLRLFGDVIATALALGGEKAEASLSIPVLRVLFVWLDSGSLQHIFGRPLTLRIASLIAKNIRRPEMWPSFVGLLKQQEDAASAEELRKWQKELAGRSHPDHAVDLSGDFVAIDARLSRTYSSAVKVVNFLSASMFSNLGVTPIDFFDGTKSQDQLLYFYVLRQAFANRPKDEVHSFWDISAKDPMQLMEYIEHFARVFMVNATAMTNLKMAEMFKRIDAGLVDPNQLLKHSIDEANAKVGPIWMEYYARVGQLKDFFEQNIEPQGGLDPESELGKRTREMRDFFDHLHRNVKFLVTYPNMIMLAYYAKKVGYSERIKLPYLRFPITLDGNLIMQELMEGKIPPLFLFTNYEGDGEALDRLEVMYAMYFAVKSDLLTLYNVDPVDWFEKISAAYIQEDQVILQDWSDRMTARTKPNSPFGELAKICTALEKAKSGTLSEAHRIINPLAVKNINSNVLYGRLGMYAREPLLSTIKAVSPAGNYDEMIAEGLEIIRSDIDPKLRNIMLIRSVYARTDVDQVRRGKVLAKMDNLLSRIEHLRRGVLARSMLYENTVGKCVLDLSEEEWRRRGEMFNMELEFQGLVFTALAALNDLVDRRLDSTEALRASTDHPIWKLSFFDALDPKLRLYESVRKLFKARGGFRQAFKEIVKYEQDYDHLGGIREIENRHSGNFHYFYRFRYLDMYPRLATYVTEGFNGVEVSLKMDKVEANYPETLKDFREQVAGWQMSYMDLNKKFSYFGKDEMDLSFEERRDQFVTSVMQKFSSFTREWFFYIHGMAAVERRWMQTMVALQKLKYEIELDPLKQLDCDRDCIDDIRNQMAIDALELIYRDVDFLRQDNLNQIVDDESILGWLGRISYRSWPKAGPYYLFARDNIHQDYVALTDDTYTYLTSYHLGKWSKYRGYRPMAENIASNDHRHDEGGMGMMSEADLKYRASPFERTKGIYLSLKKQKQRLQLHVDQSVFGCD